jgi:hypothetical protein
MTAMSATAPPKLELPPGARLLGPRDIAKRMGVTMDTATKLLAEGNLVAYQVVGSAQVHITPAEKYAVTQ